MENKKLVLVNWSNERAGDLPNNIYNDIISKGVRAELRYNAFYNYSEIITPNVDILCTVYDHQLEGRRADQMFGYSDNTRRMYLKDRDLLPYWGSVAEYVKEIEDACESAQNKPEIKPTVRAIDCVTLLKEFEDKFGILRKVDYGDLLDEIKELINDQPTLDGYGELRTDVALERGDFWIQDSTMEFGFKCTKCGDEQLSKTKFCPNCRSKMSNFE